MIRLKRGWLLLSIFLTIVAIFFNIRFLGFAINATTPSNVTISAGNSFPVIGPINSSLFICESQSMFYQFNATDIDGDVLTGRISPQDPFFVFWVSQESPNTHNFAIVSGTLDKGDVGGVNNGFQLYQETVFISDNFNSSCCEDSEKVNITVVEKNNVPVVEDIGVKTIYTQGENSTLYEVWSVNDTEFNLGYGGLTYNISIKNSSGSAVNLFNISSLGVINFTANTSTTLGVYNVTVCVNDTGLSNPHQNISSICGNSGNSQSVCDSFSLTITDENRPPNITSYYPTSLEFSSLGTSSLFFNITKHDPDGTIPDAYWYLDGVFRELDSGSFVDTFSYTFGCGISGIHNISVEITDGLLNDSLQWNVTINEVSCAAPPPVVGGGEGGGGGFAGFKEFSVYPEFITTTVLHQQGKSFDINVTNTGTAIIDISMAIENLTDKAILSEENFNLIPGKSKIVRLYLYALSETTPGVYFGRIMVSDGASTKYVKIVLEVKEREPLFDLKVIVPPEYKVVNPGENIGVIVKMLNIGLYGTAVDVDLVLYIVDLEKVILYESSKEVIAVETNLSIERTLYVPIDATSGTYLVLGEAKYTNISISTYDTFVVVQKKFLKISYILLILLVLILILFIIFILYKRRKKKKEWE